MAAIGFYIFYAFARVLSYLPLRLLYVFSDVWFIIAYYLIRYRRRIIKRNLRNSFPEKSPIEISQISRKFYRHFIDLFFETIKIPTFSEKEIRERVQYNNLRILEKYYLQGKSVVTLLGHYGNWEWHVGFPLHSPHKSMAVYLPLSNRYFNNWMLKVRKTFAADLIPARETIKRIYRYQQDNELIHCAFLADQSPQIHHTSLWLDFLNQDTPVYITAERIARKFNAPVVYMQMSKIKRGYYKVDIQEITSNPGSLPENEITRIFFRLLEREILQTPEYWLWTHRRWKISREKWEKLQHS
jgi:Kdo2-lipid IVA lauroyltransferase/acyltransferase